MGALGRVSLLAALSAGTPAYDDDVTIRKAMT